MQRSVRFGVISNEIMIMLKCSASDISGS